jgi:Arc/MetJ-type ribon-helix-helix transcriptional regulator
MYFIGGIMNINLKLTGVPERAIDQFIELGYASSKTEAIRFAILRTLDDIKKQDREDELVVKKMQQMDEDLKSGKAKILNSKEALGEYEKYLYED